LRSATQVWALTPRLRKQFEGIVDQDRIHDVANAVPDLPGEVSTHRFKSGGSGALKILYLANLLPSKGALDLTQALRLIGESGSGWQVRIAGGGDEGVERRLRTEIDRLPAAGPSVELVGEVRDAEKVAQLRWADIFVYPTCYPPEGQPLVLLEAMAAGLPIISTRHAGIPETVRHDVEGLLTAPGDETELAEALLALASDSDARARLAQAARRRYEAAYTPTHLRERLEEVLAGAISGQSGAGFPQPQQRRWRRWVRGGQGRLHR
jgi:colanic acid/amylovoran biosynthesis glycosyltransferase